MREYLRSVLRPHFRKHWPVYLASLPGILALLLGEYRVLTQRPVIATDLSLVLLPLYEKGDYERVTSLEKERHIIQKSYPLLKDEELSDNTIQEIEARWEERLTEIDDEIAAAVRSAGNEILVEVTVANIGRRPTAISRIEVFYPVKLMNHNGNLSFTYNENASKTRVSISAKPDLPLDVLPGSSKSLGLKWELPSEFVAFWLTGTSKLGKTFIPISKADQKLLKRMRHGHIDIVPFRVVVTDVFGNVARIECKGSEAIFHDHHAKEQELDEMVEQMSPSPIEFPTQW